MEMSRKEEKDEALERAILFQRASRIHPHARVLFDVANNGQGWAVLAMSPYHEGRTKVATINDAITFVIEADKRRLAGETPREEIGRDGK